MSELRDLLGTTRKYAVPIGEYLDRIGLTKREGDVRRLGPAGRSSPLPRIRPSTRADSCPSGKMHWHAR